MIQSALTSESVDDTDDAIGDSAELRGANRKLRLGES